jgi:hypothetical protein
MQFGCSRTSKLPVTRSPERQTAANPFFSPSTCLRQSPINSVHCNPVISRQSQTTGSFNYGYTVIGTHSRFTRQFLAYAQRRFLARDLFYDFPVTLLSGIDETKRAACKSGASAQMACHWPPKNFLWGSRNLAGPHHLLSVALFEPESALSNLGEACCTGMSNPSAKS